MPGPLSMFVFVSWQHFFASAISWKLDFPTTWGKSTETTAVGRLQIISLWNNNVLSYRDFGEDKAAHYILQSL